MEKGKFIFNTDDFESSIAERMAVICKKMDTAYTKADNILKNDIQNYDGWKGKQKEQLSAFMDLLTQFHKDLSIAESSPTDTFYRTIREFPGAVEGYPKSADSYKAMEEVWE